MSKRTRPCVVVTGGTGLVGHGLQEALKLDGDQHADWHFLSSKDGDLRKMDEARAIFERLKPTHVVHLAAFVGGLYRNMKYPVEFWNWNVQMNSNVLQLSHEYKVEKVLSCLSTCVFPDQVDYPLKEDYLHQGAPHSSNEAYAYSKRMLEMMSRMYNSQYGCNFTTFIPTNVYGCHDNFHLEDSHVIPGLIHKFYNAQQNKTKMTLWGTGKPLRQFIYNVDLGRLIVWGMFHYNDPMPIIFSTEEKDEISIKDVAMHIKEAMKYEGEIVFDTTKSDGQFKKTAGIEKLKRLHPSFQFTPIEKGLERTVQWFKENYDSCRK